LLRVDQGECVCAVVMLRVVPDGGQCCDMGVASQVAVFHPRCSSFIRCRQSTFVTLHAWPASASVVRYLQEKPAGVQGFDCCAGLVMWSKLGAVVDVGCAEIGFLCYGTTVCGLTVWGARCACQLYGFDHIMP
jgi:hypothetical protein